jgi:PAS domain S-box-containing protein
MVYTPRKMNARSGAHLEGLKSRFAVLLPVLVIVLGLAVSTIAAHRVNEQNQAMARARFGMAVDKLTDQLHQRFKHYEMGLKAARALLLRAPEQISRRDFHEYVRVSDFQSEFPGAIGLSVARYVDAADRADFMLWARSHVATDFRIQQLGPNAGPLFPIVFVEPLQGNHSALGLDLASEPVRQRTVIRAVMSGHATLTPKLRLLQDNAQHNGFVLMLAVYRLQMPLTTPFERQQALWGWISLPLPIERLLGGLFNGYEQGLDLRVYDVDDAGQRVMLFDAHEDDPSFQVGRYHGRSLLDGLPALLSHKTLLVGGRKWEVEVGSSSMFFQSLNQRSHVWVFVVGALISVLLAGVLWVVSRTRDRAVSLALEMTQSLQRSEQRYLEMVTSVPGAMYQFVVRPGSKPELAYMSPKVSEMFNVDIHSFDDLMQLMHPDDRERWLQSFDDERDGVIRHFQGRFLYFADLVAWWQSNSSQTLRPDGERVINGLLFDITERKEIEESLLAAQQRLALATQTARIGTWEAHLPSGTLIADDNLVALFDCSRADFPLHVSSLSPLLLPANVDEWQAICAPADGLQNVAGELRLPDREGLIRYLVCVAAVERDEQERAVRLVGVMYDVTQLKRKELEIADSEQRLELAITAGGIGLWDWHLPSGSVTYNQQWAAMLEYRLDEVTPELASWERLVHPDDLLPTRTQLTRHFSGQSDVYVCEHRLLTKSGTWKWIRDSGRVIERDALGKPLRMIGVHIDIDDIRRKEEALRESLAMHDIIFQHASVGLAMTRDRHFVRVSQQLVNTLGLSLEEIEGQPKRVLYPDDESYLQIGELIGSEFPAGRMINHELTLIRKDGSRFWGRMLGKAVDASDLSKGAIWIIEDFTERRHREELLEQARIEAELASRAKSDFLANMSHEIRTPMNAVIGFTSLLLDSELDNTQREFASSIHVAGEALLTLINDLLDFSKIEAGKMELENIEFDVRTTFDETLDIVAEKASSKNLELVCLVQPSVPERVIGDPGRMRQVLLNLVNNAIKFTEQGEVVVRTKVVADPALADGYVRIRVEVQDSGIGIPADVQPKLFSAFSQADASTTRRFGGTGLGLSICQRLIDAMGGKIGVQSEPGSGSCFWFELPLPVAEVAERRLPLPLALQGRRVLIVDDNPVNRELLEIQLGRVGLVSDVFDSPASVIAHLQSEVVDYALAILDMHMPEMDGLALAQAIHATESYDDLPLVMLTSLTVQGHARKAREANFSAFLTKPIREQQLLQCINEVLHLPPDPQAPQLVTMHTLAEREAAGKPRILLAEDNPVNQKVAVLMLEKLGCRIDVVGNGQEAVTALRQFPYDLVFMDCQMPEMDGFEATAAIRALPLTAANVPIVALTANAFKDDQDRCLASGMNDFLSKPVTSPGLQRMLERWVKVASEPAVLQLQAEGPCSAADSLQNVRKTLEEMAGMLGAEIVPEVLALFAATADELLPALQRAIVGGDFVLLERHAHRLKGTLAQIGAKNIALLAAELEQLGRSQSTEGALALLESLRGNIGHIRSELIR